MVDKMASALPPPSVPRPGWEDMRKGVWAWLVKTQRSWAELEALLPDLVSRRGVSNLPVLQLNAEPSSSF